MEVGLKGWVGILRTTRVEWNEFTSRRGNRVIERKDHKRMGARRRLAIFVGTPRASHILIPEGQVPARLHATA